MPDIVDESRKFLPRMLHVPYSVGKFGEFNESSTTCQTKLIILTINNLLADVLIRQTFFRQMLNSPHFPGAIRYTVNDVIHGVNCDADLYNVHSIK